LVRKIIGTTIVLLLAQSVFAQIFELTENKGQWHKDVKFKGELSAGAFYLKKDGYRVLQHHPDDFKKAIEQLTGHPHDENTEDIHKFSLSSPQKKESDYERINNGETSGIVRSHAYDVIFKNSNATVQIVPERELQGYANYFLGNDPTKWKGGVKSYGAIQYNNIYNGIDVRYYSEDGYLKFDIMVRPGGRLEDIVLQYEGAVKISVSNEELIIKSSVNTVQEKAPLTYQLINGKRSVVPCKYVVSGNEVRFKVNGYDPNSLLVIDPTLVFSTLSGSGTDNWGYTATYDAAGNAYGGGIGFGNAYPVTAGAFQRAFAGGGNTGEGTGFDIVLTKLNPNGTARIYSTYLGGAGNEQPHSLIVDRTGSLIVSGRTTSADYPATAGGLFGSRGAWDIVVTKFNLSGTGLIASVVLGGRDNDGVNIKHKTAAPTGPSSLFQNYGDDARSEVITDAAGNVYVASCTRSDTFPVTPGAFQRIRRGAQDALLLKFSPTLTPIFSTLFGGDADDAAYVLLLENNGDILIAGGTASNNFPGDKAGTIGPAYFGGIADGFITKFNSTGTAIIKSTYVGTSGTDQLYGIQRDQAGNIYVIGTSTETFQVRNAVFSQAGGKQFIAKITEGLTAYVYSTVFGTLAPVPNISPIAFLVDRCENVYVSGWGGQLGGNVQYPNSLTTGLTVTSNAIQSTTDGRDFYFFVLERDAASQLYGSFFGQNTGATGTPDHVDGGTSRFDPTGVIYQGICANCSAGQFPTTPGVVAPTKPANAICNLAVVKIAFDLSGVIGGIKPSIAGVDGDSTTCVPATVNFRDTIGIAQTYEWNFGDGSPVVTTTNPQISHNYTTIGNFRARLIAIDNSRCFPRDTSFVNIRVRPDRITLNANPVKLDPCDSNLYRFDNLSTPSPISPYTDSSFIWRFGDNSAPLRAGRNSVTHKFRAPGTYTITLVLADTNYCNAPDSISFQLRVSPTVIASFATPAIGCSPYTASFNNTSAGGQSFFWNFGNGLTSNAINPTTFYANPGSYLVTLVATDPSTCNIVDSALVTINVVAKPNAAFTYSPNPPEENILVTFTNQSTNVNNYTWAFGDGDTLRTTRRDTLVRHQFPQTGNYTTCLIAVDANGCSDTTCAPVTVIVFPILDVVTAFTPNNDGVNDRAKIIGFGVERLSFRIFNRWGQMVFETNDPEIGWDGRFKGKLQPMDAYSYTLEASLINGERIKKAGSISLIR